MHWWYHFWTIVMVSFTVSQNRNLINFKEFKTLPHALSLELNDMSISNLPGFKNYTGYLLSHGPYSKVFTFKIIHRPCPTHLSPLLQQFHRQQILRSSSKLLFNCRTILWILWHTVNALFLSPHLYYGTVYRILLKIQHLFHLLNLPTKHSCFGNLIFHLLYEELYLPFTSPFSKWLSHLFYLSLLHCVGFNWFINYI